MKKILFITLGLAVSTLANSAKDYWQAGEWFKAAAQLNELPADASVEDQLLKLELWINMGRLEKANKLATTIIAENPKNGKAKMLAAIIARKTGKLDIAQTRAAEAANLAPDDPEVLLAYFEIADLRGNKKMTSTLRDQIRALSRSSRRTAQMLNALAAVTAESDPHGAWGSWQRATKADSTYAQAFIDGGFHCFNKYAWAFAKESFAKALEAHPNHPDALAGLAAIAVTNSRYDEGMKQIEAALAINPNHPEAKLLKAAILNAERRENDSLKEVEQVLAINPTHVDALGMLAAHYDAVGNQAERDETIKRALAVNPTSPAIYSALSLASERRYRFFDSVAWARKAIKVAPTDWQGEYQAGVGLLRLGEEKEGYKLMDSAFKKNGFNLWAYNMLLVLDKDFKKKEFVYRETEHFFVKMDKEDDRVLWPYLSVSLEKIWERQVSKYKFAPKGPAETGGKVLILFLPSHTYFSARTVGLPGMHAAGACFGQVITMPSPRMSKGESRPMNWDKVLEHEFAHVIALQMSDYRVPRWFTEGLSTVEEEDSSISYDSILKWAVNNDKLLPIEDMNVAFSRPKFASQIPLSYYHASLVCDYLIETYGFDCILNLLKGFKTGKKTPALFPEVTKETLEALNEKILAYVKKHADGIYIKGEVEPGRLVELEARNESDELKPGEWTELAWGYLEAGKKDQATMAAEMADTVAASGEAQLILGILAWREDPKSKEARTLFAKARSLLVGHPLPSFYLGLMAKDAEDDDNAMRYLAEAVEFGPRTVNGVESPYSHLAELYQLGGEPQKAIELYQKWTAVDSSNLKALNALGELLLATGKHAQAADVFQRLIELNPYDPAIHSLAAEAWEEAGDATSAERNYRVILALEPRNMPTLHKMIRHLIDTKRNDEARKYLDRMSFFAPDDEKAQAFRDELDAQ